jgi:hypothetical protein
MICSAGKYRLSSLTPFIISGISHNQLFHPVTERNLLQCLQVVPSFFWFVERSGDYLVSVTVRLFNAHDFNFIAESLGRRQATL